MRTFVILLVVANLVYFGWTQGWLRDVPPEAAPEPVDGLPSFEPAERELTLLEELPGFEPTEDQVAPDPLSEGAEPLAPELAEGAEALDADTLAEGTDTLDSDPLAEQSDPLIANGETLPDSPLANAGDTLEGPRWCAELGVFASAEPAEALLPELLLLGIDADLATGRRPAGTTFWVHSPPFASEEAALSRLAELQEQNIDSFYMRDGDLAGRISLGVFSREESAQRVQSSLAEQDVAAEVSQVPRVTDRYWLELEAPSAAVLESPDWRALVGRLGVEEAPASEASTDAPRLTEKVCNPVASPTQFP